jgi:hypothetical protein
MQISDVRAPMRPRQRHRRAERQTCGFRCHPDAPLPWFLIECKTIKRFTSMRPPVPYLAVTVAISSGLSYVPRLLVSDPLKQSTQAISLSPPNVGRHPLDGGEGDVSSVRFSQSTASESWPPSSSKSAKLCQAEAHLIAFLAKYAI